MTAVSLRPQFDALLAVLRAVPNLTVFDGVVPEQPVTPYVVVFPGGGVSGREELVPVSDRLDVPVRVTCVGKSTREVLAAVERSRGAVLDVVLSVAGRRMYPVGHESGSQLLRDDDVSPPLLYVSDVYRLSSIPG